MPGKSEAAVKQQRQLRICRTGGRLFRNNVGAFVDSRGVPIRYGLCNETAEINAHTKSADLIGLEPVHITPEHVGTVIGRFVAEEVKHGDWVWRGDAHEMAQLNFLTIVNSLGGRGEFVRD